MVPANLKRQVEVNLTWKIGKDGVKDGFRSLIRSHRSLVGSLTHFAQSLARGIVNDLMAIYSVFFSILAHSASMN